MNADGSQASVLATLLPFPYEGGCLWSPDGGKIIYSHGEYENYPVHTYLYIMNADGSGQRPLTDLTGESWHPNWSPDGTKIVFIYSYLEDVYTVGPDGTNPRRLTDSTAENMYPVWSPDGTKIAYFSGEYNKTWYLYVMNTDGSDKQLLSAVKGVMPITAPVWVP
jgi:hypothetical protein